jgi:WD40 repeat protein
LRINCITELKTNNQTTIFYTGTPKYIQKWNSSTGQFLKGYQASDNDWVYCIEVLENEDLLVVIGSDLEYWDMQNANPVKNSVIQETPQERKAQQRPHISAITRLDHNKDMLALALFGGSVKIVDITAQRVLHTYHEHLGRVWSVVNLQPQVFASSADDKTIKIWDIRQQRSTLTIGSQPGRVSSLLRLSETILISGSCPDNVFASEEKASITFWDIRKIV